MESELIDKLDTYVSGGGRGDDRFKDTLFNMYVHSLTDDLPGFTVYFLV